MFNEEEKTQALEDYKKSWWNTKGKKYKRITVRFDEEDFIKIDVLVKRTKHTQAEVVKLACLNSLNNTNIPLESKDNIKTKQDLIKQTLQVFRNLGTNINQISKDINERRLTGGIFSNPNLTKQEKEQLFKTIVIMEEEFKKFIEKNL